MMTRFLKSIVFAASLGCSVTTVAQVGPTSVDPWEDGRAFYSEGNYGEARRYIIEAIQRDPDVPLYYLGLARCEYWLGHFDAAVYYYDVYLNDLASVPVANRRDADMPESVRGERDAANAARQSPTSSASAPQAAVAARAAFDARIQEGPILTSTGGGAVAMYEGMLRSGYANPDLDEVRERLAAAIMDEAGGVVVDHQPALPVLTLTQWETQLARLEWWLALVPSAGGSANGSLPPSAVDATTAESLGRRARVQAHIALANGQVQYLNQNYAAAAEHFRSAFELQSDLIPAHIGRLNALARLGNAAHTAEPEIARMASQLERYAPDSIGVADVYFAAFASQRGDAEAAADALGALLGIPGLEPATPRSSNSIPMGAQSIPTPPRPTSTNTRANPAAPGLAPGPSSAPASATPPVEGLPANQNDQAPPQQPTGL